MGIKRFVAKKDTTITNARRSSLTTSGSLANMGAADSLELFSIYGQTTNFETNELSRILVEFPISEISSSLVSGNIKENASYYLRLFNVKHADTLPRNFYVNVQPIYTPWDEGIGIDMDEYRDLGAANWISASNGVAWSNPGGDYSGSIYSQWFDDGTEDLELDVTETVREWLSGTFDNNGFGIFLSASHESAQDSYFTKKFSARSSEYFFQRPIIEARWNSSQGDDRSNAYQSSTLASEEDNLNTLYFTNIIRGQKSNIPSVGEGQLSVAFYSSASHGVPLTSSYVSAVTGGYVSTGVYSASFAINSTGSHYDVWFSGSINDLGEISGEVYYTGTFTLKSFTEDVYDRSKEFVIKCTNLKSTYFMSEVPRFKFFIRKKNWEPNIYGVASSELNSSIIEDTYYKISRVIDNYEVIGYGTGSTKHTKLSYNSSGNYFDFEMELLEPGYMYEISLLSYLDGEFVEHENKFKFKVDDRQQ